MKFLEVVGDRKASEWLGVKPRTVLSWRRGERFPRPAQAQKIVTRMPVTFADIYGNGKHGA